ncbi:NUDIX domain-containing protein [Rhizobium sp. MHM7A]|uniref:NUDIX domain-containing protein n=1 Tax=Rhizobium sp. MHM7A TaxID=2583233 RepID=UPI0011068840|nr:NUDIX domain-containing protein [Rhizobium sp. MHM7A]TLX16418.1 NUDIX domain-containing protein [Rhizobium sp. MHM7A]
MPLSIEALKEIGTVANNALVDFAVYIGRFQPLHKGHEKVIRDALKKAKKVIAFLGSANCPSDTRNPLSYAIRRKMLIAVFRKEFREGRLIICHVDDHTYHNGAWHKEVIEKVAATAAAQGVENPTVGLLGFHKDETSDYLDWFPGWTSLVVTEPFGILNASDIRMPYLKDGVILTEHLSDEVVRILKRWKRTKAYRRLIVEINNIEHVAATYGKGPFWTSDAIIEHRGKVLAIVRGGAFGNGLLAFPGGINDGEEPDECMLRELDEEVGMFKLNPWLTREMFRSWIVYHELFADPRRDGRGHYKSHVYHIIIPDEIERPVVRGDDDARKAQFIDRARFKAKKTFADHYHVYRKFQRIRNGEELPVPLALAA